MTTTRGGRSLQLLLLGVAVLLVAGGIGSAREPLFLQWLVPGDPDDEVLLDYWKRAEAEELSAIELVDLGTMVFHRGFPTDAVRVFRRALDLEPDLAEAWFRIGLVRHRSGKEWDARQAYKKALDRRPGHGWCNFYLGLLEEETGHPSRALEHYRLAFRHAPELADPRVNPEVLRSTLDLGALILQQQREVFTEAMPMGYLQPSQVRALRRKYMPEPTPTLERPAPPPGAISPGPTPTPRSAGEAATTEDRTEAPSPRTRGRVRPAPPPVRPTAPPAPEPGETTRDRGDTRYGLPGAGTQPTPPGPRRRAVSPEASVGATWGRGRMR